MAGGAEFNIVQKLLGITMLGSAWVLWLLIGLSVWSVAIMIERLMFFRRSKIDFADFSDKLGKALGEPDDTALVKLCAQNPAMESQVVLRGLEHRSRGSRAMEESMLAYVISERQNLDRGIIILGTLGNNTPFIGLFGTVLGIIIAFQDLARNPAGGPSVVMAGISEALIATAVGLLVAIPAVVAFNYFQRIVKRHVSNSEAVVKLVMAHIGGSAN
jgi:biopolymer transport protein ExbB